MDQDMLTALSKAKDLETQIHNCLIEVANTGVADPRWLAIARTDLEKGLLALNHSLKKVNQK